MNLFKQFWKTILVGALVILVSGSSYIYFENKYFKNNYINNISKSLDIVISSVDANSFTKLKAEDSDLKLPEYVRLREQLINLENIYSKEDIRGFYFMKLEDGQIKFFVDSASVDDKWHSEPGIVYADPSPEFMNAFKGDESGLFGPYTDEYGSFYSYLKPVYKGDSIVAVVGLDVLDKHFEALLVDHRTVQIYILITVFVVYFLVSFVLIKYFQVIILTREKKDVDLRVEEKIKEVEKFKKETEEKNIDIENTKRAILNVLEDVQDEKNNVEKLRKRLSLATKSANIGVWEWDVVENILVWDDQMYNLYGIKKEDFSGAYEAWQAGLHPEDRKKGDEAIKKALLGKADFDISFRIVWPSGEVRYLKAYASLEKDPQNKPLKMIGVNFDITHDKEVDIEKTEFVSLASHQLKTPVGAISWSMEMLLSGDYGRLTGKQKEVVSDMYKMNKRMNDLINSLLNVSRIELGVFIVEPVPVNWASLCDDVLLELNAKIKSKKHNVSIEYAKGLEKIPADAKLLHIVFLNYISNALKYTQDEGNISIKILKDKTNVIFSVSNNGESIPKKDQDKIFSKLFRASNAQQQDPDGNGLGLYLVKKIIENSGGKAWFESIPGKDTVFYASFPVSGMIKKEGTRALS